MNSFLDIMTDATNFTRTENGALTHKTTKSDLYDLFALGGAYRSRSDAEVILLFKNAFEENPVYTLKCLFYLRDILKGQGERRFFRVCMKWLAANHPKEAKRNLKYIPEFGRWDDLYCFMKTSLQNDALELIKKQLSLDVQCKTPSLLAKWMKSENTSSQESRILGNITRAYLGMNHKQYRKTLSILRERINIVERLMSSNQWDKIEFDKIPSKAGMKYRNAFARHDFMREKEKTYAAFARDENTKVNAKTLYPYECVAEVLKRSSSLWINQGDYLDDTNRLMINKYWDNLTDYFNNSKFNGLAIVDTSGSMYGTTASAPMNVAISLGMYCAEKAKGPFHNYFMTFNAKPQLIRVKGIDFCDKVNNIAKAPWGGNTNIEAAFDLMLNTIKSKNCKKEDIPENLIIISDMEFDNCVSYGEVPHNSNMWWYNDHLKIEESATLFETISKKWVRYGYKMPHLVFWNVQARQNNIPMMPNEYVTLVSGMSPSIYESIMSGKTGYDLMMEKLNSERYSKIK